MTIDIAGYSGKHLLCAVSGGADSMCLLHLLHNSGVKVTAAHFEHGIRGEESVRDMDFVRSYCEDNSIPFVCARGDVPAYAKSKGMSIEEAARELRYSFLEEKCSELGCDCIATAHNADDNAETVLMNLIRGSGAKGLSGIPRSRGRLVRPLLDVSRSEIEAYVRDNNVPYVEDSTNRSQDYTRNFIRHSIIPLVREINPSFTQAACRTAELMRRDESCLELMCEDFLGNHRRDDGSIPCKELLRIPPALGSRVLRSVLPGLQMEHVDSILDFCRGDGQGQLDVPNRRLYRDTGMLYFDNPSLPLLKTHSLTPGQSLELKECGLVVSCEIAEYHGEVNDLFKTSYLKYEIMGSDIQITSWQSGDRLRPAGRGCTKTLKSLFLERKIPAFKRGSIPVLRDENGILMVHGIALDQRAIPQTGDKVLKINFRNTDIGEK